MFLNNKRSLIVAFLVCIITVLVYLPALQNDFVNWDDPEFIYNNIYIQSIDIHSIKWMFTSFNTSYWNPLTWFSHSIDYAIWGPDPMGHHLTSIVLHGLNTFLVVILIVQLVSLAVKDNVLNNTPLIAGVVTGLLFGLHPLHVESVAWVSERKDVLSAFFYLLSILSYLRYASPRAASSVEGGSEGSSGRIHYTLSLLLFVLALMSKPMAITLPVVLIILDIYPLERLSLKRAFSSYRRVLFEKLPFVFLSILISIATMIAQQEVGAMASLTKYPLGYKFWIPVKAVCFYLVKGLYPVNLAPIYPYPSEISIFTVEYMGSLIMVLIISAICFFTWKRQKAWTMLWSFYLVTLLPVLGIIQVGEQAAADRYTYLPGLGPMLLAGLGVSWLWSKVEVKHNRSVFMRSSIIIVCVLLFSLLANTTVKQILIWKDSLTLWNRQLALYSLPIPFNNRGNIYEESGQYQEALADYNRALELDPDYFKAYSNRGTVYMELGKYQEALADYSKAVKLNPEYVSAYNNRGNVYFKLEEYQNSLADYNNAIELDPVYASAYNNRGYLYEQLEKYGEALTDYNSAIQLDPVYASAYNNRGYLYEKSGKYQEAMADFNRAAELNPEHALTYNNRGNIYSIFGKYQEAIADYNKAIEFDPELVIAYSNRGNEYFKLGKYQEALADYNKAIELDPVYLLAHNSRGNVYSQLGKYPEAIADYSKVIKIDPEYISAYNNRGNVYSMLGKYQEAIADYNKVIEFDPELVMAYSNRAICYERMGDTLRANRDLKQAARLGDKMAQEHLRLIGIDY